MPEQNELQRFVEKYGERNLPRRISLFTYDWKDLIDIDIFQYDFLLPELFGRLIDGKNIEHSELKGRYHIVEALIDEWKEKKLTKEPLKISGFEKFDSSKTKGEEIVEKAILILPGLNNIESIQYVDKEGPPIMVLGSFGAFRAPEGYDSSLRAIKLYKTKNLIQFLPLYLAHGWGSLRRSPVNRSKNYSLTGTV